MKEYIILTKTNTVSNNLLYRNGSDSNIRLTGALSFPASDAYTYRTFATYEAALEHAQTLSYGVKIYESIAQTQIEHTVTRINENSSRTSR